MQSLGKDIFSVVKLFIDDRSTINLFSTCKLLHSMLGSIDMTDTYRIEDIFDLLPRYRFTSIRFTEPFLPMNCEYIDRLFNVVNFSVNIRHMIISMTRHIGKHSLLPNVLDVLELYTTYTHIRIAKGESNHITVTNTDDINQTLMTIPLVTSHLIINACKNPDFRVEIDGYIETLELNGINNRTVFEAPKITGGVKNIICRSRGFKNMNKTCGNITMLPLLSSVNEDYDPTIHDFTGYDLTTTTDNQTVIDLMTKHDRPYEETIDYPYEETIDNPYEKTHASVFYSHDMKSLPVTITHLAIKGRVGPTTPIKIQIPNNITHLIIGCDMESELVPGIIPRTVVKLSFRGMFNKPIAPKSIPTSVIELELGGNFNQKIGPGVIPLSVRVLIFGNCFDQCLEPGIIPHGVNKITLGYNFCQCLTLGSIPSSVKCLTFSIYKQTLSASVPSTVKKLHLKNVIETTDTDSKNLFFFNDRIKRIQFNSAYKHLTHLTFDIVPSSFDWSSLPSSLTYIKTKRPLPLDEISSNIKQIIFDDYYLIIDRMSNRMSNRMLNQILDQISDQMSIQMLDQIKYSENILLFGNAIVRT